MEQQAIDTINQCAHGSHAGTMSFPNVVKNLLDIGVVFYHVDILKAESTYYLFGGESHTVPLLVSNEVIGQAFDSSEMANAVFSSQYEGQTFPQFLDRAMRAGCIGYMAYLHGQRVVYCGWLGDMHIEYFPGSPLRPTS